MSRVDITGKDAEIRAVLSWLGDRLGPTFVVVDHWDGDLCAIGVAATHDPKQLVYISSWNRPGGRYFVELETAPAPGSEMQYASVSKFDNVDREELARIVAQHLTPDCQIPTQNR
jgi:hypothetical protein